METRLVFLAVAEIFQSGDGQQQAIGERNHHLLGRGSRGEHLPSTDPNYALGRLLLASVLRNHRPNRLGA